VTVLTLQCFYNFQCFLCAKKTEPMHAQCLLEAESSSLTSVQLLCSQYHSQADDSEVAHPTDTFGTDCLEIENVCLTELVVVSNLFYPSFEDKANFSLFNEDKNCNNIMFQRFTSENSIPHNETDLLLAEPELDTYHHHQELSVSIKVM